MTEQNRALARTEPNSRGLLEPIASPDQLLQAQATAAAFVAKALKRDIDYGVIPGTDKPTLFKAGAERLVLVYGLAAEYDLIDQEVDHDRSFSTPKGDVFGLYRFVYRCTLRHRASGEVVGGGVGVCSTLEAKYRSRPRDVENTIAKMACKRALIMAVTSALGISDRFAPELGDDEAPPRKSGSGQARTQGRAPPIDLAAFTPRLDALGAVADLEDLKEQCRRLANSVKGNEECTNALRLAHDGVAALLEGVRPETALVHEEVPAWGRIEAACPQIASWCAEMRGDAGGEA